MPMDNVWGTMDIFYLSLSGVILSRWWGVMMRELLSSLRLDSVSLAVTVGTST